jgi:hypothetical protein
VADRPPVAGALRHAASHIDPSGRLYRKGDRFYRQIFPRHAQHFRDLLGAPWFREILHRGDIVATRAGSGNEAKNLVLEHERIEPLTYPYEWSMSMLRDAALLTLELAVTACDHNVMLHDATPYNVVFRDTRPVFVDIGSFVPSAGAFLWHPYQQFCQMFLNPLYLHALGMHEIARRLMTGNTEGISQEDARRLAKGSRGGRLAGFFRRVTLPDVVGGLLGLKKHKRALKAISASLAGKVDMSKRRAPFLRSLERDVRRVRPARRPGAWEDYYDATNARVLAKKRKAVAGIMKRLPRGRVVDLGANTGEFSMIAARDGRRVIAIDSDHDCVERLYLAAKRGRVAVTPVVMNLLEPSPAAGWANRQFSAASDRLQCPTGLALALIHHLVFRGGQDFDRSLTAMGAFVSDALVVEYVDRKDPMVARLPDRPGVDYGWYTEAFFQKTLAAHFRAVKRIDVLCPTRSVFLASGKRPSPRR